MKKSVVVVLALLTGGICPSVAGWPVRLPDGLVYLADIAPEIKQDMRYAVKDNFTGSRVVGYEAGECIVGEKTASALVKVNKALLPRGYGLLMKDCYRPVRAVKSFVRWVGRGDGYDLQYYPHVRRSQLISKHYIAARSSHSSGATVDLTMVEYTPDGKFHELDMGTSFDFLDPRSNTASRKISVRSQKLRKILVAVMGRYGFSNYHREWWHFTYKKEPLRHRQFDFVIKPR